VENEDMYMYMHAGLPQVRKWSGEKKKTLLQGREIEGILF